MNIFRNISDSDRVGRLLTGEIFFLVAFFWVGGVAQIVSYGIAAILSVTAISGFCPFSRMMRPGTGEGLASVSSRVRIAFILAVVIIALGGGYASAFFTKKFFLEDFNRMNKFYKQTLFSTGQDKRAESIANYESLVVEYGNFSEKYIGYHPYVIRNDAAFDTDILSVKELIAGLDAKVRTGNLPEAHRDFEQIRPMFQEMLKRNGFSVLSVALVDFHDAMELVIAPADAKDASGVIAAYLEADMKLKAVEESAHDAEIVTIRENLEAVRRFAEEGKMELLSAKAAELKSSFVKVYLKRG